MIKHVIKRDGSVQPFDIRRIENAVRKAFQATGVEGNPQEIAEEVKRRIEKRESISVEEIQDVVERVLMEKGYPEVAKAYILYRKERENVRELKKAFGVRDDLKLSVNAIKVLERRYLLKDEKGRVVETPLQMFQRVSRHIAKAERLYGGDPEIFSKKFLDMMTSLKFLPNSPTLMNAGTPLGQLSACFVLPVEDSIEGIFETLKHMALIHKSGGGTGFSFSRIRPKGDVVRSTSGVASGPLSFMKIFDVTTEVIKQGGRRRGANMGVLDVTHPDILDFIVSKEKEGVLTNFNISVAVSDEFMEKALSNQDYELINPRNGEVVRTLNAGDVFRLIARNAWLSGDPGLLFMDRINEDNPTPSLGRIEATNPCGEQPLLPYESCNLGSINLAKFVKDGEIDWEGLEEIIPLAVRFLDNVIDVNVFPLKKIEEMTKANRKIGLGVMGFADMLIQMEIPYESQEALRTAEKLMKFISERAREASRELAYERGSFPNFEISTLKHYGAMRNATVTTIAPTGSISIIAGCSSGIEPIFAVAYVRKVMDGVSLFEVNPYFEMEMKKRGIARDVLLKVAKKGSIQDIPGIPGDLKKIFLTALDISPEFHVRMQAAFQKYVDNAVSKTVNLPHDATISDVEKVFIEAYRLRCKGITVFRYGSRSQQVLRIGEAEDYIVADSEYSGGCLHVC
ncbi:MAG: ribonucleoside-diphosphate reductase alpha chain [Archaeoglobi archaeon]|nr:ribonucleoside-diphosphate reductase alpha chain [Archaeoglobi archaeon]